MMTARFALFASLCMSLLATNAAAKEYTILKIGKDKVKSSEVMDVWKSLFPKEAAPDFDSFDENIRQNVLRGIASERLIYDEAVKAGLDKSAKVKKEIEAAKKQIVMQAFMDKKAKSIVTDKEVKAAYKESVKRLSGKEEIKASHILVATEDEAKDILAQLEDDKEFDALAKEKSTDKGSGARGGDLGYFTKEKMVPEFGKAAFELKEGELSAPVKSPFGYHIIKLEDRRKVKAPDFDELKDQLRGELTNKKVQAYVENLLSEADIKYYTKGGKEKTLKPTFADPEPAKK